MVQVLSKNREWLSVRLGEPKDGEIKNARFRITSWEIVSDGRQKVPDGRGFVG